MRKSVARIVCFIIILCLVLSYVISVFRLKYTTGIYNATKFYELEDNSVDVVVIGSSHSFANFNTGVLWDEAGIAAYDC